MKKKVRIDVISMYPDWLVKVYTISGKSKQLSDYAFFASLAEGMIWAYQRAAELLDIPFTFDGCPEHHPRVKAERGETNG